MIRYKIYVDIRGGSQDLCKFSLDLRIPVSIIQARYAVLVVKITVTFRLFMTLSWKSTELFLELCGH